jgi:ABC-type lipoprotein release transport system permease subunit
MATSERKIIKKSGLSRGLKYFTILLNSFILYILFQHQNLLYFFITLLVIGAVLLIKNIISQKNTRKEVQLLNIWIATKFIKINRKYIFASIFGLIFAVLILSQTILIPVQYEQKFIDKFFEENKDVPAISVNIFSYNPDHSDQLINITKTTVTKTLDNEGLNLEKTTSLNSISKEYLAYLDENNVHTNFIEIFPYSEFIHTTFYEAGLDIPAEFDPYTVVLFTYLDISLTNDTIILIDSVDPTSGNYTGTEINIDYLITTPNAYYGYQNNKIKLLSTMIGLAVPDELFTTLASKELAENPFNRNSISIDFHISAVSENSEINVDELQSVLLRVQNQLYNQLNNDYITNLGYSVEFWVDNPLYWRLWSINNDIIALRSVLFLATAPIIALGLYLVYFSVNLIQKRKEKLISILKMRGAGETQLKHILISEMIISAIISIIVGMVLSIPYLLLILSENNYVNINQFFDFSSIIIPFKWYWQLPIIGFILAFDMNIVNIFNLVNVTIDDGLIVQETKKPFYQKYNLDIILFSIGIIEFLIFEYIDVSSLDLSLIFLIYLLSPFAVIGLVLGSTLLVSRFFPIISGSISDNLWRTRGDILALATRNMKKNSFSSSKLASLLVLGILLSFSFSIIPYTITENSKEQISYGLGSDIVITGLTPSHENYSKLADIEGIHSYTHISKSRFESFGISYQNYHFMAIDPNTFVSSAYWNNRYSNYQLNEIVDSIKPNGTMAMHDVNLENYGLQPGNLFDLSLDTVNFKATLGKSYEYFPNLVTFSMSPGFTGMENIPLLMSHSTYENFLNQTELVLSTSRFTYVKADEGVNQTAIVELIKANISRSLNIDYYDLRSESLTSDIILTTFTIVIGALLYITLASAIIGITYYSFITLADRKKEIGILRALGMVKNQLFYLLIVESLIIIAFSYVLGGIFGYITAKLILSIFFVQMAIPPFIIYYPLQQLLFFTSALVLLSIFGAYFPAKRTSEQQTGSIIRAE